MSLLWLFFASLTVVGCLAYNVSIKLASGHMNGFLFGAAFTFFALMAHLTCLLLYKYVFKFEVAFQMDQKAWSYAMVAGFAVALIDLAYFFALRHGSLIASQLFWTVGGLVLVTVAAILFFKESLTPIKLTGVVLGILSVFMMTRPE